MPTKKKNTKSTDVSSKPEDGVDKFKKLFESIQEALKSNPHGLAARSNQGFGRGPTIHVVANSGTHCFARISAASEKTYKSEFLSSVPAQIHAFLSEIFKAHKIENSGKNFLHPSGIL